MGVGVIIIMFSTGLRPGPSPCDDLGREERSKWVNSNAGRFQGTHPTRHCQFCSSKYEQEF